MINTGNDVINESLKGLQNMNNIFGDTENSLLKNNGVLSSFGDIRNSPAEKIIDNFSVIKDIFSDIEAKLIKNDFRKYLVNDGIGLDKIWISMLQDINQIFSVLSDNQHLSRKNKKEIPKDNLKLLFLGLSNIIIKVIIMYTYEENSNIMLAQMILANAEKNKDSFNKIPFSSIYDRIKIDIVDSMLLRSKEILLIKCITLWYSIGRTLEDLKVNIDINLSTRY